MVDQLAAKKLDSVTYCAQKPGHIYFASESVGEGHPDKMCD
jgi:hypothetical protein